MEWVLIYCLKFKEIKDSLMDLFGTYKSRICCSKEGNSNLRDPNENQLLTFYSKQQTQGSSMGLSIMANHSQR